MDDSMIDTLSLVPGNPEPMHEALAMSCALCAPLILRSQVAALADDRRDPRNI